LLIKGIAYWARVTGEPTRNEQYPDNPRAWSIDVTLDKETVAVLKEKGLFPKIKNKGDDRGQFITFKRKEFKKDGVTRNQPIKIVDHHGNPWKSNVLIGNGSVVNVSFNIYEDRRGQANPAILAIQVWDHVPYVANNQDEFPVKDDGETF
jgi:hypothetical protein